MFFFVLKVTQLDSCRNKLWREATLTPGQIVCASVTFLTSNRFSMHSRTCFPKSSKQVWKFSIRFSRNSAQLWSRSFPFGFIQKFWKMPFYMSGLNFLWRTCTEDMRSLAVSFLSWGDIKVTEVGCYICQKTFCFEGRLLHCFGQMDDTMTSTRRLTVPCEPFLFNNPGLLWHQPQETNHCFLQYPPFSPNGAITISILLTLPNTLGFWSVMMFAASRGCSRTLVYCLWRSNGRPQDIFQPIFVQVNLQCG